MGWILRSAMESYDAIQIERFSEGGGVDGTLWILIDFDEMPLVSQPIV